MRRGSTGQALVEYALVLPLLFLLVVNAVNFGGFLFAWVTLAHAARAGVQYAVMAGATVGAPEPADAAQIYSVIQADVSSLLNRSSLAVRSCTNNNGTVECTSTGGGTFTDPPADARPEAPLYVLRWVDVRYNYQPLLPLVNFPGLGLYLTLPPLTLHRQAVMRMLQ
jgi:Flp pilus assembly protein TadG